MGENYRIYYYVMVMLYFRTSQGFEEVTQYLFKDDGLEASVCIQTRKFQYVDSNVISESKDSRKSESMEKAKFLCVIIAYVSQKLKLYCNYYTLGFIEVGYYHHPRQNRSFQN